MITVGTVGHYIFWGCLYAMAGVGILASGSLFIVCFRVIESSGFLSFKSLPPRYGKIEAERMAQERALQKKESKSRGSSFSSSSSSSKKSKSKSAPVSPEGKSFDVEEGYTGNAGESKADRYLNNPPEPLEPEGGEDYEMAKTPKSMKKEEEKDTLFEGEGFRLEKGEGEGVSEYTV